ncbi:hypothetical protein C9374_012503 [Naegleria lovaniensis]|uniref:Uncharacterized protein n=1 Tax=Naegleria lovaniensis TaxID=51637 RepID=A0AA88H184_NAELO|nr:uncharacterized protein C9374_012503 [Naegleria lovaniensis]KAG2392251.1 hypothetical protein C9374_012503 [Naegleria lovaniensis]
MPRTRKPVNQKTKKQTREASSSQQELQQGIRFPSTFHMVDPSVGSHHQPLQSPIPNPFSHSYNNNNNNITTNLTTHNNRSDSSMLVSDNDSCSMFSTCSSSCSSSSNSYSTNTCVVDSTTSKKRTRTSSSSKKQKKNSKTNNNSSSPSNMNLQQHTFVNNNTSNTTVRPRSNKPTASAPLKRHFPNWQAVAQFVHDHVHQTHCDQKAFISFIEKAFNFELTNDQVLRHHFNRMGILNHQHALTIEKESDLVPSFDKSLLDNNDFLKLLLKSEGGVFTILSYPYIACMFRTTPIAVKKKILPLLEELGLKMPVFDFDRNRLKRYFKKYLCNYGIDFTQEDDGSDHDDEDTSSNSDVASQHDSSTNHGAECSPSMSSSHANEEDDYFHPSLEKKQKLDTLQSRQQPILSFSPSSPSSSTQLHLSGSSSSTVVLGNVELSNTWTNPANLGLENDVLFHALYGEASSNFLNNTAVSLNQPISTMYTSSSVVAPQNSTNDEPQDNATFEVFLQSWSEESSSNPDQTFSFFD